MSNSSRLFTAVLMVALGVSSAEAEHFSAIQSAANDVDESCAKDTRCIAKKLAQTLTTEHARIVVGKVVEFEPGRLRVYSKDRERLQAIAAQWKQHPDWAVITVDGYATNRSDAESVALGRQRAEKVRGYLIRYGVAPELVQIAGHAAGKHVDLSIETCARGCSRAPVNQ
ncbi:MAG: Flagellar motor rotation protein MotB [Myxococcales bacterium]|nr:Flagellar motor rotation protein MotB [Myxococcales bacterium]